MPNPGLEHLPLEAQDRIIALRSRVVELESQIKNLIEIDLVAFDKCRDELADHKDQIINLVEVQRRYRKALVFYACRANYDQYGVPHNDPKDWKDRVLLERGELKDRLEKLVDFIESPAFNDLLSEFQALLATQIPIDPRKAHRPVLTEPVQNPPRRSPGTISERETMTKTIRVENADNATFKVVVEVWDEGYPAGEPDTLVRTSTKEKPMTREKLIQFIKDAKVSRISEDHKKAIRMDLEDEVAPTMSKERAWNQVKHRFPEDEFTPRAIQDAKTYAEEYHGSAQHKSNYAAYHAD